MGWRYSFSASPPLACKPTSICFFPKYLCYRLSSPAVATYRAVIGPGHGPIREKLQHENFPLAAGAGRIVVENLHVSTSISLKHGASPDNSG